MIADPISMLKLGLNYLTQILTSCIDAATIWVSFTE